MRLLITESDPFVRHWISAEAGRRGIDLTFAERGDAIALAGAERPDCVVLDVSSSFGDEPLWESLAGNPDTSDIPVLMYASSKRWQNVLPLASTHAHGCLPLPFTPEQLVDAALDAAGVCS